ncbi:MAG: hypothetical protein KBA33_01110 [Cloacibacterium sp.]|nr:hypothetical protein [Cloacibacterium sp.]
MKPKLIFGLLFWVFFVIVSCNRDNFDFQAPSQALRFSKDTILCDTVYNQVRSETYMLKVYNKEDKDVRIPKIFLEQGTASQYRINIDGKAGYNFENIPLRAKDSLLIFIEIAPNSTATQAIAKDRILFANPAGQQHVTLLSVVQDAEFFVSTADQPKIISANTTWDSTKVKIILGELSIADGVSLNIEQGTKVYFMKNSGLKIGKNASLNVNGKLNAEVVLRGERNETRYDTLPKNWNGISLEKGALLNMNYARVFGGTTGLSLNHATANIKNTIVHTFQDYGIYGINAKVYAENLVMNNCGRANIGIFKGGNYEFLHTTLANYWDLAATSALAIYAQNDWKNNSGVTETASLVLSFKNSIAYTHASNAIEFKPTSGQVFNYLFENSLIRFAVGSGYSWDGNTAIVNSIQNQDPQFLNFYTEKMNLRIAESSPAKAKGKVATAQQVPLDIKGMSRTSLPSLGAYQ